MWPWISPVISKEAGGRCVFFFYVSFYEAAGEVIWLLLMITPRFYSLSQVLVPLVLLQALQREGQALTTLLPLGLRFLEEEQAGYIIREGGWVSCMFLLPLGWGTAAPFQFNVSDYEILIPNHWDLGLRFSLGTGDVLELKQLRASASFLDRCCKL